jgi:MFS family permease
MGIYNASLHCGLTLGGLLSIMIFRIWPGSEPFLLFAVLSMLGGLIFALFVDSPGRRPAEKAAAMSVSGIWPLVTDRTNLSVFCGIALYGAGYGIFITIIPAFLIGTKEVAQTTIGVFFALFYTALSLSQLFAGKWSDRKGRKPAMIVGLLLACLGIAAFHGCPYPFFIIFLTTASLGLGMFCVSAMAFLNERVSRSLKGTISGAFYFFWGAGYFFGPLLIGRIGSSINFPAGFSLFAALIMLQLTALSLAVKEDRRVS